MNRLSDSRISTYGRHISHTTGGLGKLDRPFERFRQGDVSIRRLQDCAHFHYESVDLNFANFEIHLVTRNSQKIRGWSSRLMAFGQPSSSVENINHDGTIFSLLVRSNNRSFWSLSRTYADFRFLDRWLHKCCFSRSSSKLKQLPAFCPKSEKSAITLLDSYLHRFSTLFGNRINCCCILNWLQMDNRGNKLLVGVDDSPINIPAKAAASAIRDYRSRAIDELSFQAGSMISVIDMPPANESSWWRGKRVCAQKGVEVGFFPSQYVRLIGHRQASDGYNLIENDQETRAARAKHGKVITFLRSFFSHRPSRIALKQIGIVKERAFGCDLGEHLHAVGQDVPHVLQICTQFIESHGIVDGIYRLNGSFTNIQKLRQMFDELPRVVIDADIFCNDVHAVSSVVKMYFRELPIPILTFDLFDRFMNLGKLGNIHSDESDKISQIAEVINDLPPPNFRTLRYLVIHLKKMTEYKKQTNMNARNLAIVWAPNLLKTPCLKLNLSSSETNENELKFVQIVACITEYLILYCDQIFETTSSPDSSRHSEQAESKVLQRSNLATQHSRVFANFNNRSYPLNSSIPNLDRMMMNCDRIAFHGVNIDCRQLSIRVDPPVICRPGLDSPSAKLSTDNLSDYEERFNSSDEECWHSEDGTTPTFRPPSTMTSSENKSVYTLLRDDAEIRSGLSPFKELDAFIDTEFADLDEFVEENKIYFNPSIMLSSANALRSENCPSNLEPQGKREISRKSGEKRRYFSLTELDLSCRKRGYVDATNDRRQSLPVYLFRCLLSGHFKSTVPVQCVRDHTLESLAKTSRLKEKLKVLARRYSAEIKDCENGYTHIGKFWIFLIFHAYT